MAAKKLEIGRWDRRWTRATEQRSPAYFERYDQHIRAWIPAYDQLIQYCAATVASEILRIYQASDTPVSILEIGYGTGSLTASIIPWIHTLCEPFDQLGQDYPVDRYRAIDRASQMRELAVRKVGDELGRVVRLLNKTAWEDVDDGVKHNVIFGSLVMHFLLGPDPTDEALRGFFHECARRLAVGGSLVFADCFAPDTDEGREAAVAAWRSWMVGNGLSEEYADAYLEGNPDMVTAASVPRLEAAAEAHNLYKAREKQVGSTQMFRLLVFQQRV
ncbi:class I SAM-dependent methyltransferase [Nonomuraea salmonea]|uniref:class I SAM-dependent methyltransferase n=1 Tax=Nonomuraea salmonea TaxID=46181 RepID=UPI002FE9D088